VLAAVQVIIAEHITSAAMMASSGDGAVGVALGAAAVFAAAQVIVECSTACMVSGACHCCCCCCCC
jgi:hypothetical protein